MDKLKGVAKGGWHPSADMPIHRDSWKSDLKSVATGKKKDPYAYAREHNSAPLSSLKDPNSFGPPPRHRDKDNYPASEGRVRAGSSASPTTPTAPHRPSIPQPTGGWGSVVPAPSRQQQQEEQEEEEPAPPEPYRRDTTGLQTSHLPKPPARRAENSTNAPPTPSRPDSVASPALPPRHQTQTRHPPPILPPRMNDHPDEYTPLPPPPYQETTPAPSNPAEINIGAAARLGQAGISVPGFGIGGNNASTIQRSPSSALGHPTQLSELQQRFSRMNTGAAQSGSTAGSSAINALSTAAVASVAAQKKPPPPPPKKPGLAAGHTQPDASANPPPPPLPLSSKPRPS